MWWTRNTTKQNSTEARCPACATHPVLVQSGYEDKKSLKCPVCKTLFDSKGIRYDPDEIKKKAINRDPSIEEEVYREQEELWENIWGA
jgi:phage FluMu protein Com